MESAKEMLIERLEQRYINGQVSKRDYIPALQKLEQAEDGHDILYYNNL